jgi:hypothetical protein
LNEPPYRGIDSADSAALQAGRWPPSLKAVETALDAYVIEIAAVRRDGLTRSLASDAVERFLALGFALELMHNNLKDLERCVTEWAGPSTKARRQYG